MLALHREVPRRTQAQARARTTHLVRIALAAVIVAPFAVGLAIGPRVMAHYGEDPPDVAHDRAVELATKAYGRWAAVHPPGACPASLDELARYSQDRALVDPWGSRFVLVCQAGHVAVLPVGVGDGP